MRSAKAPRRIVMGLILLLGASTVSRADFGALPLKVGEIREARQNAIILYNQREERQTLILQTDVAASRDVEAIFFMPLPSLPEVTTAPGDIFRKVERITKEHQLRYSDFGIFQPLGGAGAASPPDGIQIVLEKTLHEHDVTVVKVESMRHFRRWLVQYIHDKKITTEFNLDRAEETVALYLKDGLQYFLIDRVKVRAQGQQMHPLVIDFASKVVYYPLRVNKLYAGPSDVQILLFSETRIPGYRFEKIGFFATKQISVPRWEVELIWEGLGERSRGPLNLQCFRLVDPRSFFLELHPGGPFQKSDYTEALPRLTRQALKRWDHDVAVSMIFGREHDPKHSQSLWPEWPEL